MPLYEYNCAECRTKFEKLRPMSKADVPVACSQCGSMNTSRAISLFSAVSKGRNGSSQASGGTSGGCATCAATSCATCNH